MNIKNRIKKMEQQKNKPDSVFCGCETGTPTFVIVTGEQTEPSTPELCDGCGKAAPPPLEITFTIATRGILTNAH